MIEEIVTMKPHGIEELNQIIKNYCSLADMYMANLSKANLSLSDLYGADMRKCDKNAHENAHDNRTKP